MLPLYQTRMKRLLLSFCTFILVFLIGFFTPLGSLLAQEPASPSSTETQATPQPKDAITVKMTVLGIEPVKGDLEARLQFKLKGIYKLAPTYPAQDLLLTINGVNQEGSEITFREGKRMEISSIKFNIIEGSTNSYPFDRHIARVALSLDPLPSIDKKFAPFQLRPVPLIFQFEADVPGFKIAYKPLEENSPIFVFIDVYISRSLPVRFFAAVVILIMWVLSILALLIALKVLKSGKVPEIGMLSWMAVMLFAFPTIRNAQPGVPPVGTISDFLSLFWTETLVVIALSILGGCWLKRYHPSTKPE